MWHDLEKHITPNFRVAELLPVYLILTSCLAYSLTLKLSLEIIG
jgi:hypothetical protein